jgi:protein-tyrosine phosphatase
MIDCHCHVLPGIDDGAHSVAFSLEMVGAAARAGTGAILCTPHHLNGVYNNPGPKIRAAVHDLQQRLSDAGMALQLYPGAELHLVPELPSQVADGTALTFNDRGKAALVELPKAAIPIGTETILEQLLYNGVTPIIAHPERNQVLARREERLAEWVEWGCKAQLTAQSCSGAFGERLQQLSRRWLERGWVHLVASDAHRPTGRSPDTLAAGRELLVQWLGEGDADLLTHGNPQRLIDGEPLVALAPRGSATRVGGRRGWLAWLTWRR